MWRKIIFNAGLFMHGYLKIPAITQEWKLVESTFLRKNICLYQLIRFCTFWLKNVKIRKNRYEELKLINCTFVINFNFFFYLNPRRNCKSLTFSVSLLCLVMFSLFLSIKIYRLRSLVMC